MKKIVKSKIFLVLLTAIITCGVISVYAAVTFPNASNVTYDTTNSHITQNNLQTSLDELYSRAKSMKDSSFCKLISGTKYEIGSKYECTVGYNNTTPIKYNFYLLALENNMARLIQEHNITEGTNQTTMDWSTAMKYVNNNNLKTKWTNVLDIDLPMAQDIANAVGFTEWRVEDKNQHGWFYFDGSGDDRRTQVANENNRSVYAWLFDYTRECVAYGCNYSFTSNYVNSNGKSEAYGYWTRDIISLNNDTSTPHRAWPIHMGGIMWQNSVQDGGRYGVRLVITVRRSDLY